MDDLEVYFIKYLKLPANKKNSKQLFVKLQNICADGKTLGAKIVEYSKKMTELGMFKEANDFMTFVCKSISQAVTFHEASRVSLVIQDYNAAIKWCEKAAEAENYSVAETFSDVARCIFELKDEKRIREDGLAMVESAIGMDKKCSSAWLNKGNIMHFLKDEK